MECTAQEKPPDTIRKDSPDIKAPVPQASGPKEYQFRFLIVPGKTRALIDTVRVIGTGGRTAALLDVGSDADESTGAHVFINPENQWGERKKENDFTVRCVNDNNGRSQHSAFTLMLDRAPSQERFRIIVRYKDDGEDLLPIEIFDGQEFRRIGQILLENTGEWLEEKFAIPPVQVK